MRAAEIRTAGIDKPLLNIASSRHMEQAMRDRLKLFHCDQGTNFTCDFAVQRPYPAARDPAVRELTSIDTYNELLQPIGARIAAEPTLRVEGRDDIRCMQLPRKGTEIPQLRLSIGVDAFMELCLALDFNCKHKLPDGQSGEPKNFYRDRWKALWAAKYPPLPAR